MTKTSGSTLLAALLYGAALLGLVSQNAMAAGTVSTTVVANLASITYDVAGTPLYVCSSSAGNSTLDNDGTCVTGFFGALQTDFAVDNKVDLLVTEGNSTYTTSAAGSTAQVTTFTVKNEGNTNQDFALAAANLGAVTLFTKTDDFNVTGCVIALSSTTGAATFSTTGGDHLDAMAPDEIATVTVSCDIPAAQVDGSFAVVSLTATAYADDAAATLGTALSETANTEDGVEIVFGDAAKVATGDTAGNAIDSDRDAYFVTAPKLTITKTVATLCDPVDGDASPHNIPGAVVRWTITIANTGATSANLTSISDAIPTNTTFDPDMITGVGAGTACEYAAAGAGLPASTVNGNGVRIQNSVARPMLGSATGTVTSSYFTGAADADGVTVGASTVVTFTTALPAGGGYTAGELKAGETLTVSFNVGIN